MASGLEVGLSKVSASWSSEGKIVNRMIQLEMVWIKSWELESTDMLTSEDLKMNVVELRKFVEKELDRWTEIMKAKRG